jgi:hypothetical protein
MALDTKYFYSITLLDHRFSSLAGQDLMSKKLIGNHCILKKNLRKFLTWTFRKNEFKKCSIGL